MKHERLAGWGRLPIAEAPQACPSTAAELSSAWVAAGSRISRGLGRAYGDAAIPAAGGFALSALGLSKMVSFDEVSGVLVAESGVSLAEIIEIFLPISTARTIMSMARSAPMSPGWTFCCRREVRSDVQKGRRLPFFARLSVEWG